MAKAGFRCRTGRVIDTATLAAGPMVATALGEFGAEVIKVEEPDPGPAPHLGRPPRRRRPGLEKREPQQEVRHPGPPRAEAGMCCGFSTCSPTCWSPTPRPSTLSAGNSITSPCTRDTRNLVVLHVTGYGRGGPASDRPGYGTLGEAMSGFAHVTGQPGGPPTLPPFMLADGVASMAATYAVMMALYHRDVHGASSNLSTSASSNRSPGCVEQSRWPTISSASFPDAQR